MGKGIFITGTDTGVGKTVVSAALVLGLRERGIDAAYMKPVATGCAVEDGRLLSPDVQFVRGICHLEEDHGLVNPVALEPPVDPLSASMMAGREIDLRPVTEAFNELLMGHEFLVVEGIGGVAVPIKSGFDVCDLIGLLGLPAVVVMLPSLGTINHTVLTVAYARKKGIDVLGLVVNSAGEVPGGLADRTGPELVSALLQLPVIARADYDRGLDRNPKRTLRRLSGELAEWAMTRLKI